MLGPVIEDWTGLDRDGPIQSVSGGTVTKPIRADEHGLRPHFKVRVVLPNALLHLASWTEPVLRDVGEVAADWISDPEYGDTIGFIQWDKVVAVTWRRA